MSATARPYVTLRHRSFRRLGLAQMTSLTGTQMQVVALNWHVYLLTHSPLALGFVGLTRVLPVMVFSLLGGIVADRHDRRWVMICTQSAMAAAAACLGWLTLSHSESLWSLYALNAIGAAAVAFDSPARQALVPQLVPREELPAALTVNLTLFQTAKIAGPAAAGLLIAGSGAWLAPGPLLHRGAAAGGTGALAIIYLLNAVSFLAVLGVLWTLPAAVPQAGAGADGTGGRDAPWESLREGLRYVFTTPIMVWTMALDFAATFFSGAMSLLPIFADQVLHVGPRGYGLLMAAPAIGALCGSVFTSLRPLPARQGPVLLGSVAVYGLATVVYGLSRSYALTLAALLLTGLADLVSTVIRQTLRQLITPDRLRGRMTSVNMIFFMGGPQLGEVEAGLVAALFAPAALGATISVVSGGLATVAAAGAIGLLGKVLWRYSVQTRDPAGDS